jgi:ABC-2 type transport system permease protein
MYALRKLTWIELKLLSREPLSLVLTLAFPVVVLVVLIGTFKPSDAAIPGHQSSSYFLASYIAVVIGAIGLVALPVHVAGYRERGVLRRFRASSIPMRSVVGSQLLAGLAMAAAGAVVLVTVATILYGATPPGAVGPVIGAFVLATLAFLALGFLIGSVMRTARGAQAMGMLLFFPMWLLSGAAPPPSLMCANMRHISEMLPLTFAVRAIEQPWLGASSSLLDLLLLASLLAVATLLCARALRSA